MREIKPKKPSRRVKAEDGNSPIPTEPGNVEVGSDPICGHSSCGRQCQVRYIGPTTHVRDHHILHAAHSSTHAWTAAMVAGLAVVLTGAIAYTAVEAETPKVERGSMRDVAQRISVLEDKLQQVLNQCQFAPKSNVSTEECEEECNLNAVDDDELDACIAQKCRQQSKPAADESRAACLDKCKQSTKDQKSPGPAFEQCVKTKCAVLTR